ncbi:hypothetical protein [Micromonospora tarensis]|uniref:ATP-grasp target RiPP n=1 Tax=Micromonospora tarensis TaxID=2806100 RepID=A0ABS1Y9R9_9ACTN|nr:hypothetical protein [Micromonospora tarensis]MBM0274123.1 hypothetical protein [Micromonospora tarensis]
MSRIEINAGGRHIIVDHDGELEPLRAAALSLFEATTGPEPTAPATGFQIIDKAHSTVTPLGHSAYDRGYPPAPVNAQATERQG